MLSTIKKIEETIGRQLVDLILRKVDESVHKGGCGRGGAGRGGNGDKEKILGKQ